jgi:hypothetical protein
MKEPAQAVFIEFSELDRLIKQAANLTERGYKVVGAGELDGEVTVIVESDDDEKSLSDLLINANLLKK